MKLLITGASGFIGQHFLNHLGKDEFEVHALSRLAQAPNANVQWHQGDFFDEGAMRDLLKQVKPTHLLHFAWCTKPGQYWTSYENEQWSAASILMVKNFFAQGGVRFIGAGSCAEYAWNNAICAEVDTPILPASIYGASKAKLFAYLQDLSSDGASCAWGRVFWTYGPGENSQRLVPYVINNLLAGKIAVCKSGRQQRDYLHVQDVAAAFKILLFSNITGAVNIGSGHPISIRDLVSLIASQLDAQELLQFAQVEDNCHRPDIVVADVGRLATSGFKAQIDLPSGLEQTIKWWQNRGATP